MSQLLEEGQISFGYWKMNKYRLVIRIRTNIVWLIEERQIQFSYQKKDKYNLVIRRRTTIVWLL